MATHYRKKANSNCLAIIFPLTKHKSSSICFVHECNIGLANNKTVLKLCTISKEALMVVFAILITSFATIEFQQSHWLSFGIQPWKKIERQFVVSLSSKKSSFYQEKYNNPRQIFYHLNPYPNQHLNNRLNQDQRVGVVANHDQWYP